MASFTITIPDVQALRVVAAISKKRGVDTSGMNTAQKIAFAKADIRDYWIDALVDTEVPAVVQTAGDAARATQVADIKTISVT